MVNPPKATVDFVTCRSSWQSFVELRLCAKMMRKYITNWNCVGVVRRKNTFCAFFAIVRMREYFSSHEMHGANRKIKVVESLIVWVRVLFYILISYRWGQQHKGSRWCEMDRGETCTEGNVHGFSINSTHSSLQGFISLYSDLFASLFEASFTSRRRFFLAVQSFEFVGKILFVNSLSALIENLEMLRKSLH